MLTHFSSMFVHVVGLWCLGWRSGPVVKVFAIGMVKLRPTRRVVLVSVKDRLPGFFNKLDDPVGVGGVGVVAFVPHSSGRRRTILPYVLVKVSSMRVVFGIKPLFGSFSLVVAVLLC